jgi:hypothetical protein
MCIRPALSYPRPFVHPWLARLSNPPGGCPDLGPRCPSQLDLTQLQQTLLASLQPFLHDALLVLQGAHGANASAAGGAQPGRPGAGAAAAAGGPGSGFVCGLGFGEEEPEAEPADSSTLAALPPVELAVSCLKLLLKMQWALHCRAQVGGVGWGGEGRGGV